MFLIVSYLYVCVYAFFFFKATKLSNNAACNYTYRNRSNTINTEIIEPTLVTLVGTQVLYYFVRFIIRNLSIKCFIFRFINFYCCVIISDKKVFLGRVLLISLFGHIIQRLYEEVSMWNLQKDSWS